MWCVQYVVLKRNVKYILRAFWPYLFFCWFKSHIKMVTHFYIALSCTMTVKKGVWYNSITHSKWLKQSVCPCLHWPPAQRSQAESERETAVKVSRQEQRHLGWGLLPYRPIRSAESHYFLAHLSQHCPPACFNHRCTNCLSLHGVSKRQLKRGMWSNDLRMWCHGPETVDSFISVSSCWQIMWFLAVSSLNGLSDPQTKVFFVMSPQYNTWIRHASV